MLSEPILVVARIVQAFDTLGIPYVVGGSLASSVYGIPRATQDVDLVADLTVSHAEKLQQLLADDFYVDSDMIRDAVLERASFNAIHLATMFKAEFRAPSTERFARPLQPNGGGAPFMNGMVLVGRAVVVALATLGVANVTACGSNDRSAEAAEVGVVRIPLSKMVGTSKYRLDAVFRISGEQGSLTLTTQGDEPSLSTTLSTGAYEIVLESFTLSRDDGDGNFHPVAATVLESRLPFTITNNATTSVSFHFSTDGATLALGTGDLDVTFDVTETGCRPITVDESARTVQSARFFLDFSARRADNPEELAVLQWKGSSNLTESWAIDACTSGVVAHFGNSLIPPDVQRGGAVLVGSGSTGSWKQEGASIVIRSLASGCAESVPVPVRTRYTFREGIGADTIEVERRFDVESSGLDAPFRPYVPRLGWAFDRVLYPNRAGSALVSENVFACPYGCQRTDWNGRWFAYVASSGPFAGQGMIVRREPSALPADLWVDYDAGSTSTNSSSVLLLRPADGFPSPIVERNLLCFFDPSSWSAAEQAALTLPEGCRFDLACEDTTSEPVFTQLAAGEDHTCGLRSDGSVACWGALDLGAGNVPAIPFKEIAIGLYHGCGIRRSDSGITCWGSNSGGPASAPAGSFQSIAAARSATCAVASDGALSCWGRDGYGDLLLPPPGTYRYVGAGSAGGRMCAIRTDGTAVCFGALRGGGTSPPTNPLETVASGLFASCGIAPDGSIACWDLDFRQANPPPGTYRALALGLVSGCAIRTDGTLACWGEDSGGETSPPSGSYKALAMGMNYGCAIRNDDRVVCWGSNEWGQATPP